MGKTTFLRMWHQLLRNQGFHCLLFNAWENDFSDSPLLSLIGELETSLESLKADESVGAKKAVTKVKSIGVGLVKAALPTAIKMATSGIIDLTAIKSEDLAKLAEDYAQKQLEKYKHDKESIKGFHKQLSEAVTSIAKKSKQPQLIFIIDELDRCRPDYAVQLLEKVKHLFNVPNLIFVLALDTHQLGEAVKSVYGHGIDTDGYLRRFIDLEYRLPIPDVVQFVQALSRRLGFDVLFRDRGKGANKLCENIGAFVSAKRVILEWVVCWDFDGPGFIFCLLGIVCAHSGYLIYRPMAGQASCGFGKGQPKPVLNRPLKCEGT